MCSRHICSSCLMLSCQYGAKSLRNVSNTLLEVCHEELRPFWRQKGVQPFTVPNKVAGECIYSIIMYGYGSLDMTFYYCLWGHDTSYINESSLIPFPENVMKSVSLVSTDKKSIFGCHMLGVVVTYHSDMWLRKIQRKRSYFNPRS